MKHRKWHEWFVSPYRVETQSFMTGPLDWYEKIFFRCFCGCQWKLEKHYGSDGFLKSEKRIDKKETQGE